VPTVTNFNGVCAVNQQEQRVFCTCLAGYYGTYCTDGAYALPASRPDCD
jgi:hypothetical protein